MGKLGSTVLLDPMPCSKDETTKILFQEGEQEPIAIANREDPSVSKTINVLRKKTKEAQEFDEFEIKKKVVKTESRMWKHDRIQTNLGTNHLVSGLVKAVLSRNQGPNVPKEVDGRMALLDLIRVRDPFNVFFWRMQVSPI